jgi:hypothetical protein
MMLYRVLPIAILGLTAMLTAAAIVFLPETMFFPVIEYSGADGIHIAMYKTGELDRAACERGVMPLARAARARCPGCRVVARCTRGLGAGHRRILSREPLSTPSARLPRGVLTMTIVANNPGVAFNVCRQVEMQSASQPVGGRWTCYAAGSAR